VDTSLASKTPNSSVTDVMESSPDLGAQASSTPTSKEPRPALSSVTDITEVEAVEVTPKSVAPPPLPVTAAKSSGVPRPTFGGAVPRPSAKSTKPAAPKAKAEVKAEVKADPVEEAAPLPSTTMVTAAPVIEAPVESVVAKPVVAEEAIEEAVIEATEETPVVVAPPALPVAAPVAAPVAPPIVPAPIFAVAPPPAALLAQMVASLAPSQARATIADTSAAFAAPPVPPPAPAPVTVQTGSEMTPSIANEESIPPMAMPIGQLSMVDDGEFRMRSIVESIFLEAPIDPVLEQKMEPEVQMRRARFQRYVKATVGACAGMCALALVCSLFSSSSSDETVASAAQPGHAVHAVHAAKTTVESFDGVSLGKAPKITHATRARSSARR
jgi:hypothetical protein